MAIDDLDLSRIAYLDKDQAKRGVLRIAIVEDDAINDVNTDGVGVLSRDIRHQIIEQYGFEEGAETLKPFVNYTDDPQHGALYGKMAWHDGGPRMDIQMRAAGVDMLLYRSAAKQAGLRTVHELTYGKDGTMLYDGQLKPVTYEVPLNSITVSLGNYDKPSKFIADQELPRQALWNFGTADSAVVDRMTEWLREENMPWTGNALHNGRVEELLRAQEQDTNWQDVDRRVASEIDWDQVGVGTLYKLFYNTDQLPSQVYSDFVQYMMRQRDAFEEGGLDPDLDNIEDQVDAYYDENQGTSPREMWMRAVQRGGLITPMDIHSNTTRKFFQTVFRSHVMRRLLRPKLKHSFKGVMTFSSPLMGYATPGTFKTGRGFGKKIVRWGNQDNITLEAAYRDFLNNGGWQSAPDWQKRAMTMATMRVPAPSLSGIRALRFDGFLESEGQTLQFHPTDMGYMGGADLDIDTAYVFQEMPDEYMAALEKYRYEWHVDQDPAKGFREVKTDPQFIRDENAANQTLFSLYRTEELLSTGINANRGKKLLSVGLSFGNQFIPYYTNKLINQDSFGRDTPFKEKKGAVRTWIDESKGLYWTATPRKDAMSHKNGLPYLVRELVNYAADSADYGELIDAQSFRQMMMERMFENVHFHEKTVEGTKVIKDLPADVRFSYQFEDPVFESLRDIISASKDRVPVTKTTFRGDEEITERENVQLSLKNLAAWIDRRSSLVQDIQHPGLKLMDYLRDLDTGIQEIQTIKFAGLPFTSTEQTQYLPFHVKIGEIYNMDMHDREIGTGTAATSGYRNRTVYSKNFDNQDDFNARVSRMRLNISTEKIREREGGARLLERAEFTRIDGWRREYVRDPEYFRELEENQRTGQWWQDAADRASQYLLVAESVRIEELAIDADYLRWHNRNVSRKKEDRLLTVDEKRRALYAEHNRQNEELRILDVIRDRILALDPQTHEKAELLRKQREGLLKHGQDKQARKVTDQIAQLVEGRGEDTSDYSFRIRHSDRTFSSEVGTAWKKRAAELKKQKVSFGDYVRGYERFEEETIRSFGGTSLRRI